MTVDAQQEENTVELDIFLNKPKTMRLKRHLTATTHALAVAERNIRSVALKVSELNCQ